MSYWTENIPKDWGFETLKDSVSNIVDNRGKTCPTAKSGIPLIATNCIKEFGLYPTFEKIRYVDNETYSNWFRGHPKPNDILFVNKGTPGGVCIVPNPVPFCIAQDMVALRANPEKFDWKYLFAALRSNFIKSQIQALNVGTSIPHLKKTDFDRIIIPKPSLKVQKFIGDSYYSICDKIELNLQMNKTLEEMAMALYKHWFVDFGPFQDGEFVDSELGEIPKGWEVLSFSDVTSKITDGAHHSPKSVTDGKPMASVKDMNNWGFNISSCRQIDNSDYQKLVKQGCRPLKDDILIAKDGSYLKHAFVVENDLNIVLLSSIALLRPNGLLHHHLINLNLKLDSVKKRMETIVSGAAIQRIVLKEFRKFSIIVPPLEVQATALESIDDLIKKCWSNNIENDTLTNLRDTLLPKLISGEVRVKDLEKTLSEVL